VSSLASLIQEVHAQHVPCFIHGTALCTDWFTFYLQTTHDYPIILSKNSFISSSEVATRFPGSRQDLSNLPILLDLDGSQAPSIEF